MIKEVYMTYFQFQFLVQSKYGFQKPDIMIKEQKFTFYIKEFVNKILTLTDFSVMKCDYNEE